MADKKEIYVYNSEGKYEKSFTSVTEAAKIKHVSRASVRRAIQVGKFFYNYFWSDKKTDNFSDIKKDVVLPSKENISLLSEQQLREKHDVFYKFKKELENIPRGMFVEEHELFHKLNIWGKPGARAVACYPEIAPYKGKVDGVIYYGNPDNIEKLKDEGILS